MRNLLYRRDMLHSCCWVFHLLAYISQSLCSREWFLQWLLLCNWINLNLVLNCIFVFVVYLKVKTVLAIMLSVFSPFFATLRAPLWGIVIHISSLILFWCEAALFLMAIMLYLYLVGFMNFFCFVFLIFNCNVCTTSHSFIIFIVSELISLSFTK